MEAIYDKADLFLHSSPDQLFFGLYLSSRNLISLGKMMATGDFAKLDTQIKAAYQ